MSLVALVLAMALSFTCDDDSGCQALSILHWFIAQWLALSSMAVGSVALEAHVIGGSLEAVRRALPSWHWLILAAAGY